MPANNVTICDYKLVVTCGSCPEQYDVFMGMRQVGYLRLRHGGFSATCPDVGGEIMYQAEPMVDGEFEDDERAHYLGEAVKAIDFWIDRRFNP